MTDRLLRRLLRYMINSTVQQTFGLGQRACDSFGCRDGNVSVLIMCRDNGQSVIVAISLILPNQGKLGAGCTQSRISGREVSSWVWGRAVAFLASGVKQSTGRRPSPIQTCLSLPCSSAPRSCCSVLPITRAPGIMALSVRHPFMPVPSASDWSLGEPLPLPRVTQTRGGGQQGMTMGTWMMTGSCLCV